METKSNFSKSPDTSVKRKSGLVVILLLIFVVSILFACKEENKPAQPTEEDPFFDTISSAIDRNFPDLGFAIDNISKEKIWDVNVEQINNYLKEMADQVQSSSFVDDITNEIPSDFFQKADGFLPQSDYFSNYQETITLPELGTNADNMAAFSLDNDPNAPK